MKVFISHSWKNKTEVQRIADDLKAAGVELWLDSNHLLPGQQIQNTIDEVLRDMDVIVLAWSQHASQSDGVSAEIYTGSRMNKMIIPCYLDDTPVTHPYIEQIKGIHFHDFIDGIGRLKMALLNYMARDFNMQDNESIRMMNEFMGTLETVNHLVHKEDIKNKGSNEEKDYWIKKVQDTEGASFQKLKEEADIGRENGIFLNEIITELKANLNNKEKVGELLQRMKQHKYAGKPDMKKMTDQVQSIYDSFANTEPDDAIKKYKAEMESKLQVSKGQLKANFGILADYLFTAAFENMSYFFLSSADHLDKLSQLGRQQGVHPVVADCAGELLQYVKTPGGVIDNNQYGILGYADDAYFIHSLVTALQQEGVINTATWNIDWVRINAGCEVVFNMVGNHIRQMLDQHISAYCQQLVQKHTPQAAAQPSYQQQLDDLQKAKDDLWQAKIMSLQTAMIHNPTW